jgi:hypothetical protein
MRAHPEVWIHDEAFSASRLTRRISFRQSIAWARPQIRPHRIAFTISSFHGCAPNDERHLPFGIAAVGKDALDEQEQWSARPAQQMKCSITVLNISGFHNRLLGSVKSLG